MRNLLPWYDDLTQAEWDVMWQKAIVTFDTNVLLDLYRLKEATRFDLLNAMEAYGDQVWLSHQVAMEFFKSRRKVISDTTLSFNNYNIHLDKIQANVSSSIEELRKYRVIPLEISQQAVIKIGRLFNSIKSSVNVEKDKYPDFYKADEVLPRIYKLFDNKVGPSFSEEYYNAHIQTSIERYENKIPPGYHDVKGKSAEDAAGDYILWLQALEQAKEQQKPLILVTSERKPDWWEKDGGRYRMRSELSEEGYKLSGQRVSLIRTDDFLKYRSKGQPSATQLESVNDVKNIINERSSNISSEKEANANVIKEKFSFITRQIDELASIRDRIEANKENLKHAHPGRSPSGNENLEDFQKRVDLGWAHIHKMRESAEEAWNEANDRLSSLLTEMSGIRDEYRKATGNYITWSTDGVHVIDSITGLRL